MLRRHTSSAPSRCGLALLIAGCSLDQRQVDVATRNNVPSAVDPSAADPSAANGSSGAAGAGGPAAGGAGAGEPPSGGGGMDSGPPSGSGGTRSTSNGSCAAAGCNGCGDGVRSASEACDDGNILFGDGCSGDCRVAEAGFSCAVPGEACMPIAVCGDGVLAATEQCDDRNVANGDGCSARCTVEAGTVCDGQPSVCRATLCGDGISQGAEDCDDGNGESFDGCSARCAREPICNGTTCQRTCGDGFVMLGEACDDGNLLDGDGCSSACQQEIGFICVPEFSCEPGTDLCATRVPIVYRDFADTHPDFGNKTCISRAPGAVATSLDANGRPVLAASGAAAACLSNAANFADWFSASTRNVTLAGELLLFDDGFGGFTNRYGAQGEQFTFADASGALLSFEGTPTFFPVDSLSGPTVQLLPASIPVQYGPATPVPEASLLPGAPNHDFYFTSELQVPFLYDAELRATLTIQADDDVWVYLNGRLALDVGGIHDPIAANLDIDARSGVVATTVLGSATNIQSPGDFGLLVGSLSRLSIFHAERQAPISSLMLDLNGFDARASHCSALCGDGILRAGEECDNGRNNGGYGQCAPSCVLNAYCGDGITQTELGEGCDVGPGGDDTCRGCRVLAL